MKKILFLIAILFILLLAAVGVYIQSDSFSERIRPFVQEQLQAVLGSEARIGRVKANFLPPYLEARDIVVPDARGIEAVSVRRIKIYLNPVPLLQKKVRLPSITLLEPRINLERASDGTFNITPLVERIKENLTRPRGVESSFDLLLKTISVRQGEIWFKDAGLSSRATMTGLDMTVRFNVAKDRVSVVVRSSRLTFSASAYPEITGTLKAAGEYDRGLVRVKSFDLTAGDTALNVSGSMGLLPESALDLKGRLRSGPQSLGRLAEIFTPGLKRPTPRVEASVTVTGKNSDPQVSGDLRLSGIAYRGMTLKDAEVSFRYRDHALALSGEKGKTDFYGKALIIDRMTADLAYYDGILDIRAAEIASGDLAVRMQGTVNQARGFDAGLAVESSGAGKTLSFLTSLPVEGAVALQSRLTGALSDYARFKLGRRRPFMIIGTIFNVVALFGFAAGAIGDVNRDGRADFILGANANDLRATAGGRVFVYLGGNVYPPSAALAFAGTVANGQVGGAVSGGADLNGDGYDDWIVGAPGTGLAGTDRGRAYVFLGAAIPDSIPDLVLQGTVAGGAFSLRMQTFGGPLAPNWLTANASAGFTGDATSSSASSQGSRLPAR